MTGETDNPSLDGTDNAQPLEADTPDPLDYYDPDEDNVEDEIEEGTDNEEQAEADTEEQSEVEEEAEEEAEDEQAAKPALVTLANGEQVTHDELVNGYQRQADYTRGKQDISNQRKSLAEGAERIERITQSLVDHLSSMVPPEPDASLAFTNAEKYMQQKAQYDASIAQVQKLIEMGAEPKQVNADLGKDQHDRMVADERIKLAEALPETATSEGQKKFWADTVKTAAEFGFTEKELSSVIDHRVFVMAHWAAKGRAAEQSKAKAKAKAQNAAPATPRKPGQPAKRANNNANAMRKLSKSGSMQDALAVDFD